MINQKPLITVLVSTYKNFEGIYDTLNSVFIQNYPNIELLITDDGSPNLNDYEKSIKDYIESYKSDNIKRVIFNKQVKNLGTVKNFNSALKFANGDYLKILASDDMLLKPNALLKYYNFMKKHNVMLCFAKMQGITVDNKIIPKLRSCEYNYKYLSKINVKETENRLYKYDFLPAPAAFFDMRIFKRYGYFLEQFRLVEDWPYWIYLAQRGVKFGYIDDVLINYRLSGVTGSGNYSKSFLKDEYKIIKELIIPYDHRFGIMQNFVNNCKLKGIEMYMDRLHWTEYNKMDKYKSIIKYFPFYIYINIQKIFFSLFNWKI